MVEEPSKTTEQSVSEASNPPSKPTVKSPAKFNVYVDKSKIQFTSASVVRLPRTAIFPASVLVLALLMVRLT